MKSFGLVCALLVFVSLLSAQKTVGTPSTPAASTGSEAVRQLGGDFDPGSTFVKANTSFEEGDYETAINAYRALLDHGYDSARIYYNLGNALLRNGELGRAIAAYRWSQALAPRGEDVAANLEFARRETRDALLPPEPSPLAATLFFWHYRLSRDELAMATMVLNLLLWSLVAVRLFRRDSEILRWGLMIVLLLTIAAGGSLFVRHVWPTRVAVVVPAEVDAHTGPDGGTVVRFKLHAGTEVPVKDSRDGWLRIALPDGQQGWLDETHVEVVID